MKAVELIRIGRTLVMVAAVCVVLAAFEATSVHAKEAANTMPNGTWNLTVAPPPEAVSLCDEYLPTGTRVRLVVAGPTRQAVEEQRRDELGGSFTLLPPWPLSLCSLGLGATTGFGTNLCHGGAPRQSLPTEAVFDDAVFTFSRLTAAAAKDPDNEFFAGHGARTGARFMLLTLKDKGLQWRLWLKSSNEMLGECLAILPGKNNIDSFPMVWRLK